MVTTLGIGALLAVAAAAGGDWTQWRGLGRDGVGTIVAWPPGAEPSRRWAVEVGSGQSSPVVSGATAFVFSREGETEVARAVALDTGKVRWRTGYPAPYRVYPGAASFGDGPKSTPIVHEGRLFTLGIGGILSAFDAGDGRLLWQKSFAGRFPATAPPFGTSMSPLVAGNLLIVHAGGHDGGALLAFDPATGRERWALEGDGPSYSSPILARFQGDEQIVIQVHRKLLGVAPASGKLLWSVPFVTPCDQNIVTPLQAGELLVVSSLDKGTLGVRVSRKGAAWSADVAWQAPDVSMYMSSPVLASGRVIGLSHRKKGQYFALDPANGSVQWKSDPGQGENAALVVAGGSLLVLEGDGELLALSPDATSFSPVSRHQVTRSQAYAHPVPTASGLLIRDGTSLSLQAPAPSRTAGAGKAGTLGRQGARP
jgi:outer membrane protein assembly factor BamB